MDKPGPTPFPTLATARLRLRALTEADTPAYRALLHLPEVTRYTNVAAAPDEATALQAVRHMIELFPSGNGCAWAIEEAGSRAFVGAVREAWTVPGNGGSDRVLEKAGFRLEGVQRQRGRFNDAFHDWRLFGRLAPDPL
jgi:ribosomal-protein-alanine N-acetyltransferase